VRPQRTHPEGESGWQGLGGDRIVGKSPGKIDVSHYIAVDSTGAVYVADFRNWRVEKIVLP
jgi:hypothetical protein